MIVAQHRVIPEEFSGRASDIGVGGFLGLERIRIVLARCRNDRSLDAGEQGQAATHIILADDQAKVRSALRFLLEQVSDWQVIAEVETADALLSQTEKTRPDVILLDWELPGIHGQESISRLKACCGHVRIIALSSQLDARKDALEAGADVFVSKSDPPERILNELRTLDQQFDPSPER
jgi:CheY-like chemotaxis protein